MIRVWQTAGRVQKLAKKKFRVFGTQFGINKTRKYSIRSYRKM
jgi:hypothetical protein